MCVFKNDGLQTDIFSLEISFKWAECRGSLWEQSFTQAGLQLGWWQGQRTKAWCLWEAQGRYGSYTRACPLKLEMDQRYGFIFQDVFLPGCQMPFVTPPTLLSIRIWAKRISELKEFLSVRHLAQEAVPAPPGSLGSWRKTLPAPCCLADQLHISAAA